MKGFKSFANKTKIKFDNQITAVVGPNGSGKSNIADAIKWVLGEQSAKTLRGKKMNDIIFQGSDDKKPMNMAEVNLTFENKDRALESDYDFVKVSRRIYRNGDNEYRLNGKRVRLKDVRELFLDTGIGKEGYSVIGQGRIDEILNSSNQERRTIFEEASGIATHKYRREESIKKLDKVDEDLEVINREWDYKNKDKNRLEIECKNYKEYEKLINTLNIKSLNYFKQKSKKLEAKKIDLEKNIEKFKISQKELTDDFNLVNKKLAPISSQLRDLEEKDNEIINQINKNDKSLESLKNQIKLDQQKLDYNKKDLDRNKEDENNYKKKCEDLEKSLEEDIAKLKETKLEIENLEKLKEKNDKDKLALVSKSKNLKDESVKLKIKIDNLKEKISDYEINQKTKNILNQQREENNKKIKEKISSLNDELKDLLIKKEELANKNKEYQNQVEKLKLDMEENKNKLENLYLDKEKFDKALNQNNISCKEEISNYKIQKSLLERNEGYFYAVSDFLNKTRNNEIKNLYVDTLANLITVKEGYENVIENLIGQGLQNIVTWSKKGTREIINYVNENNLGRLTFLPLDSIKQTRKKRVEEKEVIAMAYDLVRYDEKLEDIINHFLSNTVVVKNIDDAVSLSNKIKGYRIISLNLDLINTWGSMVAGVNKNRRANTAILNRNKKINDIKLRITNLRNDKSKISEKISEINSLIYEKSKVNDEKKLKLSKLENDLDKIIRDYEKTNYENSSLEYRLQELNESIHDIDIIESEKDLSLEKEELDNFIEKEKELLKELDKINNNINLLSNDCFKIENNIEIKNRDINILDNKISSEESEIYNLKENIAFNVKLKKSLDETIDKLNKNLRTYDDKINIIIKDTKDLKDKKIEVNESISQKRNDNKTLLDKAKKIEKDLNDISMKIVENNYSLESVSKDFKNIEDEIRPFISESLENIKDRYENLEQEPVKKEELYSLQRKISKVGFFDENSVLNYKEAKENFEFLDKQKFDLEESKKDIEKMIKKLEDEMKVEFIKKFNMIDEKFQRIFKELFMGGKAKLKLDSNELLDAGVDISACPPNKTTKSISLLSGGEKSLTAIALLFAIFETNPAPFSLLDEIDAAMDESNIKRYIDYLKSLSDKTQFIMITHRQTTMQLADKIHGVTIGDGGISKIYSIDFDN